MDDLGEIEKLREKCPSIKKIFLPDGNNFFINWKKLGACLAENPQKSGHQRSSLMLALERGQIEKITAPVRHFLLDEKGEIKKCVTKQWRQDLREGWIFEVSPPERHRKFRMFMGKMVELKVAQWLEENEWRIEGLEALGCPYDILAKNPTGETFAIEIKYIGVEDDDFQSLLNNLEGDSQARSICPYTACNYALSRIYEAAHQLKKSKEKKIVVLVVSALAWPRLEISLMDVSKVNGGWMEEWGYKLCRNESTENDCKWIRFYLSIKEKHPNIDTEMPEVIKSLSQVRIMTIQNWELSAKTSFDVNMESAHHQNYHCDDKKTDLLE
jgi:hypothetical protein